ncbi:glutamate receptor 2.2-like [Telopea speciosissima]|uniref:glutamate receptor 2.2-like n=1 Tax=Telopea speciosissima TaxID=54955 RepID=UPI001CC3C166|nr:glutamate receptor 2.2-like [Telopea speciosissima]
MVKSTCLLSLIFFLLVAHQNGSVNSSTTFFHVGVVIDLTSKIGETAEICISMALSDFYNLPIHANYTTRLELHTIDSQNDVVVSASSALYLMKDVAVQAIIGPQQSTQASFVIDLGEKALVPILSFSATSPSLSPLKNPYVIRTAIDDSTQVKAIAAIIQAFEWKEVVLIYEDTDYGNGVMPYFIDAFQDIDVRVPYWSTIPLDANDDQILEELHKLTTMQTRVFIVHMSSSVGSRLFINANNAGMMSQGYAWIVTDGLSSLLAPMDSNAIESMQGVLGIRPYIPKSKELEGFKVRWKRRFYSSSNTESYSYEISEPSLYGIWAYDTVWALAMAVEQVGTLLDPQFLSSNTNNNLTDLSRLGYSSIGPQLLQTILGTRFKGLSGDFHLVKGQLKSYAFQIFNVIGEGERVIGYWTPTRGISRQLDTTKLRNSTSMWSNLKAIVWPGDSTTKPKGWAIPTNGQKRLKVLVPIKYAFEQFVKVERDPITNKVLITGFCIDVFSNVTSRLPFGLPYEFQPYSPSGNIFRHYNELIDLVHLKKFDAAVGDITILANRSIFLDFTMPYTESGLQMVVAMKDNLDKEFWMFVKPLSLDLWLMTMAGFIYIGVVVWILERHTNIELGVSSGERLQTSLWYSFLTLVFAQREKIERNLTRSVMITWVFFVLILTQSYTASLSSMLTVRQLQPTITDVNDIMKNGYYVGHQRDSFVRDFLTNYLNLDKSKLKGYHTPEEYHDALSAGTQNGGVAAIFIERPYIPVFLNMYCNKYTTVGRIYSSEGFGFVFPKGSPLVPYMSMGILNLTDDGTIDKIKQSWIENQTDCSATSMSSTNQLTMRSFGGLFLIIGVVSVVSLLIHFFRFENCSWHKHTTRMSPKSRWQKAGHKIICIRNALKRMHNPVTEVGSMELHRRGDAEHREEGIVEEGC